MFPATLGEYVDEDNPVRVIEAFVDALDLGELGFNGLVQEATGRPSYHPSVLLKIYVYGYLNRIASSRRLERETQRNIEMMWLTGRLMPDFKTISNFRKVNAKALRVVCREFVVLCRNLDLFSEVMLPRHRDVLLHKRSGVHETGATSLECARASIYQAFLLTEVERSHRTNARISRQNPGVA